MKKVFTFLGIILVAVLLVACGKTEYEVSFDVNGGAPAIASVKLEKGKLIEEPAAPTKEGYRFDGWHHEGEAWNFAEDKVAGKMTLVAQWLKLHTVTYDLGYEGAEEIEPLVVLGGESLEEPEAPEREGYLFLGWEVQGEEWDFEEETVTADVTLVAKWGLAHTVTYDVNYEGGEEIPSQVILTNTVAQELTPEAREGYRFLGWQYEVEEDDEVVLKDFIFETKLTADITLIAKWHKVYEVEFDINYEEGNDPSPQEVLAGHKIEEPVLDLREFHDLLGWALEGETELFDFDTIIESDVTLVAQWKELDPVTVSFDPNYEGADEIPDLVIGEGRTVVNKFIEPVREGYTLLGWLLDDEPFALTTGVEEDITLVANWEKKAVVSFDTDGGSEMADVLVQLGHLLTMPTEPRKQGYIFAGWLLNEEAYDFNAPVLGDMELVATWTERSEEVVYVRFVDHRQGTVQTIEVNPGEDLEAPADPVRSGYRFGGWYLTRAGRVWNEIEAQTFPIAPEEDLDLYAYWEPLDSSAVAYSKDETYVSTMVRPDRIIINPLEYRWSHEDDFIDMLVTPLYSTEVDWDKAIADGIADYPGDFSKIESDEYSIEAFDYQYVLVGGAAYPVNENGDEVVIDGKYDRDLARTILGKEWTYEIRKDLVFEDGTPIDARTFEYTLQQWLDPDQNTYRANMWYKNAKNQNGRPVLNTEQYLKGLVTWDEVGFKLGEPDAQGNIYSFTIFTTEEITLQSAVSMGNAIRLVHPERYQASIDAASGLSQYGTPAHPYASYGGYILVQWDSNQRMVFNKNYDYVARETINYKSHVIEIVSDTAEAYNLYKSGLTSVLGLTKDYYAEYAEDPDVKDSWNNFPQYMIINQSGSKLTGAQKHDHPTIMADARFRQALLFGFDRKEFAYNIYAPNKPAISPIPSNAVHYLYDPLYYTETEQHRQVVEHLGFELDDYLFGPERAIGLFEDAYADWIAEGNTGPVTLRYVSDDSEFSISLDQYIKESYENLFKDEQGNKRLIIDINNLDGTGLENQIQNHNFDLTLTALGFGSATNAFWQYAAIALYPAYIGASGFGLNYPYIGFPDEDGEYEEAEYVNEKIKVDFTNTYNYLISKDEEELLPGEATFLDMLDEEGMFSGTIEEISEYILFVSPMVFDGGPEEPFPGAAEDLNNLTAAFEKVFFEYVPVIPTVTRAGSTVYASNVNIEWPKYSSAFSWGAARYRYLTTDPDFVDRK